MESWRKITSGIVENPTLEPVALIPVNGVVAIRKSQYEDSMHKYGMHGVDYGIPFGKTRHTRPIET